MISTALKTIPDMGVQTFKYVMRQTSPSPTFFTAAGNTQFGTVFGLPPFSVVCGVRLQLITRFAAFGLSSCQVTVGAVSGVTTNANYYAPAFECVQVVSPNSFMFWSPFTAFTTAPHDVTVSFLSTGAFLNTLTAGELSLSVSYRVF